MSYSMETTETATGYEAPVAWQPESPFPDVGVAAEWTASEGTASEELEGESPFLAGESPAPGESGLAAELHELMAELYDREFDESLLELTDAAAQAAAESPFVQGETASAQADGYLREWLEPLQRNAHAMLEAIGESLAGRDLASLTETELDEVFAEHEPIATGANPVFENFLGGLWKKVQSAVSGAVNVAKKGIAAVGRLIPIGPILERLKGLVRPLLERVLQMALNRLPPTLRPAAELLKRRLFGETASEHESTDGAGNVLASASVSELQREFDAHAASLLLAADEDEREAIASQAEQAATAGEEPITALNAARERFIGELQSLPDGGDPTPAVQNFLPAVMAALPLVRLGISLIGRDRVVSFLAGYVGSMIRPYVGSQAPVLAQAIVSAGLTSMSLETPADPREAAASVLAGTVEDTARRLAEHDGNTLEDPQLLEAAVTHAFTRAVAGNFPSSVVKRDHRESDGAALGMWVATAGNAYKKFSRVLSATIMPASAARISTFGGVTLQAFLSDHYGLSGRVGARVHLYEATAGTRLGRIAAAERSVPGLGHARAAWKLLPLTPEAAGLLLGQTGLGAVVDSAHLASPAQIAVGQRFYYLELPGPRAPSAGMHGRSSHVDVRFSVARHEMVVAVHLSEGDAQRVASALRASNRKAAVAVIHGVVRDGFTVAFSHSALGHLHWVDENTYEGETGLVAATAQLARAVRMPHQNVHRHVGHGIRSIVAKAIAGFVEQRPGEVVNATERHRHGITFLVSVEHPDAIEKLRVLSRGQRPPDLHSVAALFVHAPARITVKLAPEHTRA